MFSENVAREVLFMFGHREQGWQPGSFSEALMVAFMRADSMNFNRLTLAYPDYGQAMRLALSSENPVEDILAGVTDNSNWSTVF